MIVTVIPISTDNAHRAEFLIDWIYQLAGREKRGHALLAFDGVHEEYINRIKATAELAFESFDIMIPNSKDTKEKMASAIVRRNNLFMSAAEHCQKSFRCPFLMLEPECTPTNAQWLENIENLWESQARRYMLCHLRDAETGPRFPLSIGVYHMGFWGDVAKAYSEPSNAEIPWERIAGENIVGRSTKCRAFQPLKVISEEDFAKVWPEAQIVTNDQTGAFIEKLRADGVHLPKPKLSVAEISHRMLEPTFKECYDSQTELAGSPLTEFAEMRDRQTATKPDLRTKAGREWKAAHANGNGH